MRPAGARLISPSSVQYAHSTRGTRISAFGKAGLLSAVRRPFTWSPWKCEITTVSTALRSMPAALRFVWNWPAAPFERSKFASPVPVSITTSLPPVLTTIGV